RCPDRCAVNGLSRLGPHGVRIAGPRGTGKTLQIAVDDVTGTTEATPGGFNRTIGRSGEAEGIEIASTSPVLPALPTIRSSGRIMSPATCCQPSKSRLRCVLLNIPLCSLSDQISPRSDDTMYHA